MKIWKWRYIGPNDNEDLVHYVISFSDFTVWIYANNRIQTRGGAVSSTMSENWEQLL